MARLSCMGYSGGGVEESWGAWGLGRGRVSQGIWCRGRALTLVLPDMLP